MRFVDERLILENHYEWCKKEGRNTSWYGQYKRVTTRKKVNVRVETS